EVAYETQLEDLAVAGIKPPESIAHDAHDFIGSHLLLGRRRRVPRFHACASGRERIAIDLLPKGLEPPQPVPDQARRDGAEVRGEVRLGGSLSWTKWVDGPPVIGEQSSSLQGPGTNTGPHDYRNFNCHPGFWAPTGGSCHQKSLPPLWPTLASMF